MELNEKLKARIEVVKRYEKTKKVWRKDFDSKEFKKASGLNYDLFGMPLNKQKKCQCVEDLFYYINNLTNEKLILKSKQMTGKFKLKADMLISLHGLNHDLSNANLTDESAIDLLSKYPGHIASFETYPDNWKQLINNPKKAAKVGETPGKTAAELLEEKAKQFEEMGVDEMKEYAEKDLDNHPISEWGELTEDEFKGYLSEKAVDLQIKADQLAATKKAEKPVTKKAETKKAAPKKAAKKK